MLRYIWPALFFAATWYVWQYNGSHTDSKLLFPFVDMFFPAASGNPAALGEASVKMALALSFLVLIWEVIDHVRAARRAAAQEREERTSDQT